MRRCSTCHDQQQGHRQLDSLSRASGVTAVGDDAISACSPWRRPWPCKEKRQSVMRTSTPVTNTLLVDRSVQRSRCSIISATRCGDAKCRNVVILGGGIIGASTAYYLSKRGVASTIIERSSVASAASGELSRSSPGSCTVDICQQLHDHGRLLLSTGTRTHLPSSGHMPACPCARVPHS